MNGVKISMRITRYGLSPRVGGWDRPGDSGTDNWEGDIANKISLSTCAPSLAAREALGIGHKEIALLKITFPDQRLVFYRETGDEAPEDDARIDLFFPWQDATYIPDFGFVEVVHVLPSSGFGSKGGLAAPGGPADGSGSAPGGKESAS